MKNELFQNLDLTVGERASCSAGYPKKSLVVVECIKDFSEAPDKDSILNNSREYVKVIHYGLIGLGTSHLICANWTNVDIRFNN